MPVSIVARVQAHPSRAHLRGTLTAALAPLAVEICEHTSLPPDPWAGYRACLSDLPDGSTHILVVQDDAQPVANFAAALEKIADRHPDTPVCLFLGASPANTAAMARRASVKGQRYIPLLVGSFVPIVAVLWPHKKAEEFMYWARSARRLTRADDGNAAKWQRVTRQRIMVSVPSLCEHNDFIRSVKGGRTHKPGAESWRRALLLAEDALSYEW